MRIQHLKLKLAQFMFNSLVETIEMRFKIHFCAFIFLIHAVSFVYSQQIKFGVFLCNDTICELNNVTSSSQLEQALSVLSTSVSYSGYDSYYGTRSRNREISLFTEISCTKTKLEKIPSILFKKFTMLKFFNASDVGLESISRDDFKSANYLTILNLSRNNITILENMLFLHCSALVELDLSQNQINWIHDSAFEGMSSKILRIDLSFNKISTFKEDFFLLMSSTSTHRLSSVNLNSNEIDQIVQSNKTNPSLVYVDDLNLGNNKLNAFELPNLKARKLSLVSNKIESLTLNGFIEVLLVSENKLKELFISSSLTFLNAQNNEISSLKCDNSSSLENVLLSHNKLTSSVLSELKNASNMKSLDLSDSMISSLNVESFAYFEMLEELNLGQNQISFIDYGIFSHQKNLVRLDISYNSISEIDLHVLATLSKLKSLNLSGNKFSTIDNYEDLRRILPQLSSIGLEGNNWDCGYLTKLKVSIMAQNITIVEPQMLVKNKSSIMGIECTTKSKTDISMISSGNTTDDKMTEKFNQIIEKVNHVNARINQIESNKTDVTSLIFGLQKDILNMKSETIKNQFSSVNTTKISEVRLMVEQMNNLTLDRQKLAYDQLIHKINEQNLEISKFKMETEKLLMNLKVDVLNAPKQESVQHVVQERSSNSTETIFIAAVISISITFLAILGIQKLKKFCNSNTVQMSRQRISRRNSVNTITTFDNSSV